MRAALLAMLSILFFLVGNAIAQQPIRVGEKLSGELNKSDFYDKELNLYRDFFTYIGKKSERIRVTVWTDEPNGAASWPTVSLRIGTDPLKLRYISPNTETRIDTHTTAFGITEISIPEDDSYTIILTGTEYTSLGKYSILVERVKAADPAGPPLPTIEADEVRVGYIDKTDSATPGLSGYYYDDWLYKCKNGERIRLRVFGKGVFNVRVGNGRGKNYDALAPNYAYVCEGSFDGVIRVEASVPESGEKIRYRLIVDSLGLSDWAAQYPPSDAGWFRMPSLDFDNTAVYVHLFAGRRLSSGIARGVIRLDPKKPDLAADLIVAILDVDCDASPRKHEFLSAAVYRGGKFISAMSALTKPRDEELRAAGTRIFDLLCKTGYGQ